MGEVIRFPDRTASAGRYVDGASEPAAVVILPVVRIERAPDGAGEPHSGNGPNRGRRRKLGR